MPQFQIQTFLIQTIYLILGLFLFIFLCTKFILTSLYESLESRRDIIARCGVANSGQIVETIINSYVLSAVAKVSSIAPHENTRSN